MAISANMALSEDSVDAGTLSGYGTLAGDDPTTSVVLPFTVTLDGVGYTDLFISGNGWVEFGPGPGFSDFSNDCLPTSPHSGPMVAAYWDDLAHFGGGVLEFGFVGIAPNQVYIVNYDATTLSGGHETDFQIQIHETSNVINVKYFDMAPGAIGQSATIGYQHAGGAAAITYPLVCNGEVLDDNTNDADPGSDGWSIVPIR